jgi:1,4-dihydroxy-2-naphthoyl-CoA hydrolase
MKKTFSSEITVEAIEKSLVNTFADAINLHFVEVGADYLKARLRVSQAHTRPGGIMNGGVSLGIIETVGSVAARCMLHPLPKNSLGIQVNANHLRVVNLGDELTATASPVHIGRSTQLWDVTIVNQEGKEVSLGRITLLVVEALPNVKIPA